MGVFASGGGGPEEAAGTLDVLAFGAHPDDCELRFGG